MGSRIEGTEEPPAPDFLPSTSSDMQDPGDSPRDISPDSDNVPARLTQRRTAAPSAAGASGGLGSRGQYGKPADVIKVFFYPPEPGSRFHKCKLCKNGGGRQAQANPSWVYQHLKTKHSLGRPDAQNLTRIAMNLASSNTGAKTNFDIGSLVTGSQRVVKVSPAEKVDFHRRLLEWLIETESPFRMVEEPTFQDLFPRFKPYMLGRHALSDAVGVMARAMDDEIRYALRNEFVSLTWDGWTDRSQAKYAGIVVHWIDGDWKSRGAVLAVTHYAEKGSALRWAKLLTSCLLKYGIPMGRVMAGTNDNTNLNPATHRELENLPRVPCFAHVLQLGVQELIAPKDPSQSLAAGDVSAAVARVKKVLVWWKAKQNKGELCAQSNIDIKTMRQAPVANATRWGSALFMILHYLRFAGEYYRLVSANRPAGVELVSPDDIKLLLMVKELLVPLQILTTMLQDNNRVNFPLAFYLMKIRHQLFTWDVPVLTGNVQVRDVESDSEPDSEAEDSSSDRSRPPPAKRARSTNSTSSRTTAQSSSGRTIRLRPNLGGMALAGRLRQVDSDSDSDDDELDAVDYDAGLEAELQRLADSEEEAATHYLWSDAVSVLSEKLVSYAKPWLSLSNDLSVLAHFLWPTSKTAIFMGKVERIVHDDDKDEWQRIKRRLLGDRLDGRGGHALRVIRRAIERLQDEPAPQPAPEPAAPAARPSGTLTGTSIVEDFLGDTAAAPLPNSDLDEEILAFLHDPFREWDHAARLRFPRVAKAARAYFSLQPSSAEPERVFSAAGRIRSRFRMRLSHSKSEHLIAIKMNRMRGIKVTVKGSGAITQRNFDNKMN